MSKSSVVENLDTGVGAGRANPVSQADVAWPSPNDQGVFEELACEQIYAPITTGLDCTLRIVGQPDGWRATFSAHLPEGDNTALPSMSDRPHSDRAQAIVEACEWLIAWLSAEKDRGSKKHQKLAAKMQDWVLDLEKQHRSPTPAPAESAPIESAEAQPQFPNNGSGNAGAGKPSLSFAEQMLAAPDAEAGRDIIAAHEAAVEALERSLGLTPSCGQIEPNHSRGFSVLSAKDHRSMVKRAKAVNAESGAKLADLIADGVRMLAKPWEDLYTRENTGKPRRDDRPSPTPASHPEASEPSSQDQPTPKEIVHTSALPEGELRLIPITQLFHSPWNPRQHYPEAALSELVESMRTSGFRPWLPLMVRPIDQASEVWRQLGDPMPGYEIGAGHRRRIAAERAGITQIPCIVRPLTDEQFLDVLNFDNTGREDVHPLHEAAGWRNWMERTGKGVLDIAARIGQSKEYVYQRLKYSALIPEAQAAFLEGKITGGHAILIARQESEQKRWLKFCLTPDWKGGAPSVRALIEALHRDAYVDLRDECPFDRSDKALLAGAGDCEACPKRAANIPGFEFEKGEPDADLCTDRACHGQKLDNHLYRIRTNIYAEEGHFPLQVSNNWATKKKGVYARSDWDQVKAGEKGAQTAVVVEGEDTGKVLQVRRKSSAPAPSPETGLAPAAKAKTPEAKADETRKAAEAQQKEKAKQEQELGIRRQILLAVRAKVGGLSRADLEALLVFVLNTGEEADTLCPLHGVEFSPGRAQTALCNALPKMKETELFQLAVELSVASELDDWQLNRPPAMLLALAKRYKVDAAKIRKEADKAAPEAAPEKPKAPAKKITADARKRIAKGNKVRWAKFKASQRKAIKKKAGK